MVIDQDRLARIEADIESGYSPLLVDVEWMLTTIKNLMAASNARPMTSSS